MPLSNQLGLMLQVLNSVKTDKWATANIIQFSVKIENVCQYFKIFFISFMTVACNFMSISS